MVIDERIKRKRKSKGPRKIQDLEPEAIVGTLLIGAVEKLDLFMSMVVLELLWSTIKSSLISVTVH